MSHPFRAPDDAAGLTGPKRTDEVDGLTAADVMHAEVDGLRRALGATKGHIRTQFLSEAILLGLLGGAVGVALGVAATAVYAHTKHWATIIPTEAWAGGIASSLIIGALAGLIPALRAARLSPTQALWSV